MLPALGLLLRGAVSAAARSGAAGRGVGGVARIGKMGGEYLKARSALSATPADPKRLEATSKALDNFSTSLGVNGSEISKAMKEWRDNLVESGKSLAQYNGTIARAYQELAIGDIQRKVKLGKSTAGSTAELAASENRRRDTTVNFEALSTNIQNRLATVMNNATATVGEFLDPIAESLNKLVEIEGPKSDGIILGLKPLDQLAQRDAANRKRPSKIEMGS